MTVALVNLLEYSARDQERFVPVSQELAFVRDYLKIQEVRASCKVDIRYDIQPEVETCVMLKMLLQPAIENAILHGFQEGENHKLSIAGQRWGMCLCSPSGTTAPVFPTMGWKT